MDITLEQAIKGFRLYNEASGRSKKTSLWYENNLDLFHKWIEKQIGHKPHMDEVTTDLLRNFLIQMRSEAEQAEQHPEQLPKKRVRSMRTVPGYYASLSAFLNWAVREELLDKSPMKNIARPKVPRLIPDPLSEQEIRALLTTCKNLTDRSSMRMTAMVLFLLDSGVRVGEMLKLKLADLDLEQGRAKVMGKGAKERYVYFGRATKRVLWRYISLARPEPAPNVENLFLTIVPLTDWKERYEIAPWMVRIDPDTANGLSKHTAADAFQIRSVSQSRFVNRMGRISNVHLQEILKAIQTVIGA